MKKNTKSVTRRYIIERGNWYLTEKNTYSSMYNAISFDDEIDAINFLNNNGLSHREHQIVDTRQLLSPETVSG